MTVPGTARLSTRMPGVKVYYTRVPPAGPVLVPGPQSSVIGSYKAHLSNCTAMLCYHHIYTLPLSMPYTKRNARLYRETYGCLS